MNAKEQIEELVGYLLVNLRNLQKNPNRRYLEETLERKKQYCADTYRAAQEQLFLLEDNLSSEELVVYKNKLDLIYRE